MSGFNFGMPGNTAVDAMISRGTIPVEEAQYLALLAIAFELRTQSILAAQATPDWLNNARVRMGEQTFPPTPAPDPALPFDQRCGKPLMDGRNEIRCWLKAHHEEECR